MICVQLWRNDDLASNINTDGPIEADRVIDRHINDVQTGTHGKGRFLLAAHHAGRHGAFVGHYFRSDLRFPLEA